MSGTYTKPTYSPVAGVLAIVARYIDGDATLSVDAAKAALKEWEDSLATPAQIAMVETNDELEIDDTGAGISEGDRGFFIQTWTWVECPMNEDEEDAE